MEVHIIFDFSYCILGILLSFYVIFLVLFRTHNGNVRVYKKMLIISTVIDIMYGCSTAFSIPSYLFCEKKLFVLFENPVLPDDPKLLLRAFQIQTFFIFINILIVPIQFYFRYIVVCQRNYNFRMVLKPLLIALVYVFLHAAMIQRTFEFRNEVYDEILVEQGLDVKRVKYMVGDISKHHLLLYYMLNGLFMACLTYLLVGAYYCLTRRRLRKLKFSLSESTKRAQRQVGQIATIQAIYPMLCICTPCIMICTAPLIGLKSQLFGCICSTLSHIFPVLNALSVIICVPSYRRKTLRFIRRAIRRKNEVTVIKVSSITPNDGVEFLKEGSNFVLTRVEHSVQVLAHIPKPK
ncbi:unnamed protein product [Bursaphelenchus xylophilus]|uniref:(pine wood nematode) hypothetical protein n=1 Tax=Bursaphelenchus xylophilus TaxID=6326 RepID=A0A1I7RM46_BURXY|nr:unnamed protein product [Bursaphelenchus xylophilus]CAG9118193.1 unnamed protein product [Bursaphelenchus xylophilus]